MMTQLEMDILEDLLLHGDNSPGNIADNTDRHEKSVPRKLSDLEDEGLVRNKGGGVWTLTQEGLHAAQVVHQSR